MNNAQTWFIIVAGWASLTVIAMTYLGGREK